MVLKAARARRAAKRRQKPAEQKTARKRSPFKPKGTQADWNHSELAVMDAETYAPGSISNMNSHMKRFLNYASESKVSYGTATFDTLAAFGKRLAREGLGEQVCRNYLGTIVRCWGLEKPRRFDFEEFLFNWEPKKKGIYRLARAENVIAAPFITRSQYNALSKRSQRTLAQIMTLAVRMASALAVSENDYVESPNGDEAVQIKAIKFIPDAIAKIAKIRCLCGQNEDCAKRDDCPKCSGAKLNRDDVQFYRAESRRLGIKDHSPRRTAVAIIARFFAEVMKRQPSLEEFKRIYNLLGWKLPRSGNRSLYKRYSAGSEQIKLDNLPEVGQALVEAVFERDPIIRAPQAKEEYEEGESSEEESD